MKSGPEAAADWRARAMAEVDRDYGSATDQELLKRDMAARLVEYHAGEIVAGRIVIFDDGKTLGVL